MLNRIRISLFSTILLFALCIVPIRASEVSEVVMNNGLKVLIKEDHAAELVAIDIWVRTGLINETPENNGVSHFLEHMIFKGTNKRPEGKADLEIESLGATLDASTSRDWTRFNTTVASRYFANALDVMADAVTNAALKNEDIEKERRIILDEIARRDEDPVNLSEGLFYRTSFKAHPYMLEIEGTRESVTSLTRDTLVNYYKTWYVPNNMTVVIVGDVDAATAIETLGRYFNGFAKKELPKAAVAVEPEQTEVRRAHLDKPFKYTHMVIGFRGPAISTPEDVWAMDVLLSYLGVGYRSWLSTELKDKQKLIMLGTGDFLTQRDPGTMHIYAAVEPANVGKVENAVVAKIKELRTSNITDFDLARCKRSLEGTFAFESETYSGTANALGFYDMLSSHKFATDYIANIRKVTTSDIRRVVEKYLDPEKMTVVTVGPKGAAE